MGSNRIIKKDSKQHSDFKGVIKNSRQYLAATTFKDENGKKKTRYNAFKYEVDAARAYNEMAVEKYGLAARINTVPVPGLECVGNCEWELGPHYFTKEDLEPKE